jgi:hypothetical protein
MELNENTFCTKDVALNEISNFVVVSFFTLKFVKMLEKNNIKLQQHIIMQVLLSHKHYIFLFFESNIIFFLVDVN